MWDFLLQRAKAIAGIAAPLVTAALMNAVEQGVGVTIPSDIKVYIIAAVTGIFVHQVSNKPKV